MFHHSIVIYLFAAAVLITSCGKKGKSTAGGPQQPPPVITAFIVDTSSLSQNLELGGTLYAEEEVQLRPEVNARITGLYFREGSFVQKGQLLIKLFDADLRAQLQKLQLQRDLANTTLQRQAQLLKINGISQQEYDISRLQVDNLNADINLIRAQLSKTEIRAPFDGKMGLKSVSEGAYITAGTVVSTLQQTATLKVDFSVPEKYEALVKAGDSVFFSVEGREGGFSGVIYALDPFISTDSRTLRVRARFKNTAGLFPGVFAKVNLKLRDIPNTVVIPSQAVIPEARNKKVIVLRSGVAEFRNIITGIRTEEGIQVEEGLAAGDTIVITGLMQIKPGMQVKVSRYSTGISTEAKL